MESPLRTLKLLEAVVRDGAKSSVAALARETQIPVPSAHRHIAALVDAGFLSPAGYGRHIAGPKLAALSGFLDEKLLMANVARPILDRLAKRMGCVTQLGIFENDMVTYLVKSGQSAGDLFTKVGMQLEAYCSGIGKVLLAHLPDDARSEYLEAGPFIALTERTITDPDLLGAELQQVAREGFAVDDEEVVTGLQCIAVPVRNSKGEVIAAISASRATQSDHRRWQARQLPLLQDAADEIGVRANIVLT
ncbi:IclR family transcriptional regulator [uncultured Sphingorhabdus sp.]|uniref:IclR family transcriptional regulator n=1 Tax=uncultured Sphingorhabdus sp. TaxID=1686106 RepID=UPI0026017C82|nr:IclR family transcriptional regulator [uncultured Sphingorhabdus sp.]HMS20095.1 IclR family transcriptional regulator [Sphingorhabdus sp.]